MLAGKQVEPVEVGENFSMKNSKRQNRIRLHGDAWGVENVSYLTLKTSEMIVPGT
jgi:hypothetical protein